MFGESRTRHHPQWGHAPQHGAVLRADGERAEGEAEKVPDFWESLTSPVEGLGQMPGHVAPAAVPRAGRGSAASTQDGAWSQDAKRAWKIPQFLIGAFPLNSEVTLQQDREG